MDNVAGHRAVTRGQHSSEWGIGWNQLLQAQSSRKDENLVPTQARERKRRCAYADREENRQEKSETCSLFHGDLHSS